VSTLIASRLRVYYTRWPQEIKTLAGALWTFALLQVKSPTRRRCARHSPIAVSLFDLIKCTGHLSSLICRDIGKRSAICQTGADGLQKRKFCFIIHSLLRDHTSPRSPTDTNAEYGCRWRRIRCKVHFTIIFVVRDETAALDARYAIGFAWSIVESLLYTREQLISS